MAQPQIQPIQPDDMDVETYLAWEETQEGHNEYISGKVLARPGSHDAHCTICLNLATYLKAELRGTPCRTFISGMKLRIDGADAVLYPDVFVTCSAQDREPEAGEVKRHPILIAEVLSGGTGAYDRGRKFELYQQIPDLHEYLLIEQDRQHADLFRKNDEGLWVLHPTGAGGTINVNSLGLQIPLARIYDEVDAASD